MNMYFYNRKLRVRGVRVIALRNPKWCIDSAYTRKSTCTTAFTEKF